MTGYSLAYRWTPFRELGKQGVCAIEDRLERILTAELVDVRQHGGSVRQKLQAARNREASVVRS